MAAQHSYLYWTRARLFLVVVAALAGLVSVTVSFHGAKLDLLAFVSVVGFLLAFAAEIYLLATRPEQVWYYGRAIAESAKTLSWRYAMRSEPFQESPEIDPDALMLTKLKEAIRESPVAAELQVNSGDQITPRMRSLRNADFPDRKHAYLIGRIDDQISWYTAKANYNRTRARFWRIAMLVLELGGAIGALLRLTGVTTVSSDGFIASMVAGAGAWLEVKQFENLASAYSLTATELALARNDGEAVTAEDGWPTYVGMTEEAISREHTMWLVRRVKPRLGRI